MDISILNGSLVMGRKILFKSFPHYREKFQTGFPQTLVLEEFVSAEVKNPAFVSDPAPLLDWIPKVIEWGQKYESCTSELRPDQLIPAIRQAAQDLKNQEHREVLEDLLRHSGLHLTCATKILRFLDPKNCPVFDQILAAYLPFLPTPQGYAELCSYLRRIAAELSDRRILNPIARPDHIWYVADIEAALSMFFRELRDGTCPEPCQSPTPMGEVILTL